MKTISMLDFRNNAEAIVAQVSKGQRMVLTYRGKPVVRLEPYESPSISDEDPFYSICDMADPDAEPLSNAELDRILYGS